MSDTVVKVENIYKEYRLGAIGSGTLYGDLQSFMARIRGKEDPYSILGQENQKRNDRFMALSNVSFEVKRGEKIGIIGHNGAGKSTLLKILSRITAPSSGTIKMKGRVASMLEVGTGFHVELTGRENVFLNGAILGMSKEEISRKFDEIVAFAEMEKFIDTPVKRYSSGMFVKLAFAVAAHLDNEILIMDEVLAVGDMKFQEKCLGKMGDVADNEGKTILYVSHNMNTVRTLCDRCIVLNKGVIQYDGDVEKAIEIYMNKVSDFKNYVDFSNIKRESYLEKSNIEFKYLRVLERDMNIIKANESLLNVAIGYSAQCNENDVYFRIEIAYADGTKAGTSFSEKPILLERGDGEIIMNISVNSLVEGVYQAVLIAYKANSFGTEKVLDRVEPAMTFKIENSGDKGSLEWLHNYWGYVKLPNIEIRKIND